MHLYSIFGPCLQWYLSYLLKLTRHENESSQSEETVPVTLFIIYICFFQTNMRRHRNYFYKASFYTPLYTSIISRGTVLDGE